VALGGIWSRITGGIVALGVGAAARDAIDPVLEVEKQQAWARRALRVLDPGTAAAAEARSIDFGVNYADDAKRQGIGRARYRTLAQLARHYPGLSEVLTLLRRKEITPGAAKGWLQYQGFSDAVSGDLLKLAAVKLAPADVANAIQQGFIPGDGILPADPGGDHDITPPVEVVPIDPQTEAADDGIDPERLKVLAQLAGLPPGPMELLEMWRREVITETAVERGIREGHTKTKWTSAYKALKRPLLNPGVLVRLVLKGWYTEAEIAPRMALHGYDAAQLHDWFLAEGRPAAPQQMANAVARGVVGPDNQPMDKAQFLKGIKESDIRPEWGEMLWGVRFAYPSLFQLNRLVSAGAIDAATAAEWSRKVRLAPEVVTALEAYWGTLSAPAVVDPLVKSAHTYVLTRVRNVYVQQRADETEARGWLGELGIDAAAVDGLIQVWNVARQVPGAGLTRSQLKKAFKELPAQWSRDRTLAELEALGMEPEEAQTFLDE
jgi:hypothetical protein